MKKTIALSFAIVVYTFTVILHGPAGIALADIFNGSTRRYYDQSLFLIVLLPIGIFVLYWLKKALSLNILKSLLPYLLIQLALTWACYYYLIILNSEGIHFLQYGWIAFLLYFSLRHHLLVFLITLIAGSFDELYQYLVLGNGVAYFDFNDVILDAVGSGWGLLLGSIFSSPKSQLKNNICWIIIISLVLVLCIGFGLGYLTYMPSKKSFFSLINDDFNTDYWIHLKHGVVYHIVRPVEAILSLTLIGLIYLSLARVDNDKGLISSQSE